MSNQNAIKHGLKKHKYYARWRSFIQRCYEKTNKDYPLYGGKGIRVDRLWRHTNPEGIANFIKWIEDRLKEQPELRGKKFKVIRDDVSKDFSPNNCSLVLEKVSCKNRSTTVLDAETVVEMRRFKKANMEASLEEMQLRYQTTTATISRALRGVSWGSVNDIEPPIAHIRNRTLT